MATRAYGSPALIDTDGDARLLSVIGHELRSPLSVILGLAGLLDESGNTLSPADRAEIARRIVASADRLEHMLEDLIDIDRSAVGLLEIHRRPTNIGSLVANLLEQIQLSDHRPVDVDVPSLSVEIDPEKVERIVENLVVNADRYAPRGTPISIAVRRTSIGIVLTVSDQGPGIPDRNKQTIFEPFDRGLDEGRGGHGVGLSIVSRFARLHGGRVWASDRTGGGSTFTVELPAEG